MGKLSGFISFVLILLALVCATVAYSTYWYQTSADVLGYETVVYTKYDKVKTVLKNSDGDTIRTSTYKYTSDDKDNAKNTFSIYNAALAFDIIAWIILLVAAVITLFQAIGILSKIPLLGGLLSIIGKFVLIAATVCLLLSLFIFIGLKNAQEKDCEKITGMECDAGNFVEKHDNSSQGPYTGWAAVVVGTAFCIAATVVNICGGVF